MALSRRGSAGRMRVDEGIDGTARFRRQVAGAIRRKPSDGRLLVRVGQRIDLRRMPRGAAEVSLGPGDGRAVLITPLRPEKTRGGRTVLQPGAAGHGRAGPAEDDVALRPLGPAPAIPGAATCSSTARAQSSAASSRSRRLGLDALGGSRTTVACRRRELRGARPFQTANLRRGGNTPVARDGVAPRASRRPCRRSMVGAVGFEPTTR